MKTETKMAVFVDQVKARFIACENGKASFAESIESGKETHIRNKGEVSNQARFSSDPYQGSNNEYSKNTKDQEIRKAYFHLIKDKLLPYDEILIFGAGQAKKELQHYLQEQSAFKNKSINVQSSDYVTDNQLLETVRVFFNNK